MSFFTIINCIDGRTQLPVIEYLQQRYRVDYVDSVTEAGPNLILFESRDQTLVESILRRVAISIDKHRSLGIAVVGHHDCAGNPSPFEKQQEHTHKAVRFLRDRFSGVEVIGLWVDRNGDVHESPCP